MYNICPCGRQIESIINQHHYISQIWNDKGEIIFAICQHGYIVINKIEKEILENLEKGGDKDGKSNNI